MRLFEKIFCLHKWKTHSKEVYEWQETEPIRGTLHWWKPMFQESTFEQTKEVLICDKCGKIKIISY